MANQHLTALKSTLAAIQAADVIEPEIPFAVAAQEWADLATVVGDPAVRSKLLAVGLSAAVLDTLPSDIDASRAAQSEWTVLRDRSKSQGQRTLEEKGYALRQSLLQSCRWNLRHDRIALGTLAAIAEGEGVADLIQDLLDLSYLIEKHVALFAGDQTFNAQVGMQEARSVAGDLQAGASAEKLTTEQNVAKDIRDRAYTYTADRVTQIRQAGRYVFRDDPAMARKFASAYRRRQRRRTTTGDLEPTPVEG
jgi:hypothetical protein